MNIMESVSDQSLEISCTDECVIPCHFPYHKHIGGLGK